MNPRSPCFLFRSDELLSIAHHRLSLLNEVSGGTREVALAVVELCRKLRDGVAAVDTDTAVVYCNSANSYCRL